MKNKSLIVVLDESLAVGAFLHMDGGFIQPELLNPQLEGELTSFLSHLETHNPRIERDLYDSATAEHLLQEREVMPEEAEYPTAICEELRRRGLRATVVPAVLKSVLSAINQPTFSGEQRNQFWAEIAGMNEEEATVWAEVKKNRDEWGNAVEEVITKTGLDF